MKFKNFATEFRAEISFSSLKALAMTKITMYLVPSQTYLETDFARMGSLCM